jgi:hypothetical protein
MTTARGLRNNNPGNIEWNDTPWQGLDTPPHDGRFCRFVHAKWGIRAIARTLITYQDKHGINTVRGFINRWAPPVENDTGAYVQHVADKAGVRFDEVVNIQDYAVCRPIVEAIIRHENGKQPYKAWEIDEGLKLAGVVPLAETDSKPPATPGKAMTAIAASAAPAASAAAGVLGVAQSDTVQIVLIVAALVIGLGAFIAWRKGWLS